MATKRGHPVGVLLVMGSCLSLQFGVAIATQLFPVMGPWGVTTIRLGVAGIIVLAVALAARSKPWRWHRRTWAAVAVLGGSLAGMNGFFFAAIERLPLSVGVAIEITGPLLLAALLSRSGRDLLWVGMAGVGMVLLAVESLTATTSLDLVGVVFAAVAGSFWALYILANERVGAQVPGVGGLGMAMVIGGLVLLPLGASGAVALTTRPELMWFMLGVVLLSSVLPYSLELSALRRLPAPVFSVLLSLEPAFAAAAGWLLLGQTFGWLRATVIVLVIAASIGITQGATQEKDEILSDDEPASLR